MATFQPSKESVKNKISQKDVTLKLFKAIILEMLKRGKTIDQIKVFSKNPGPESLNLAPDAYSSRDTIFNQIKINTSLEDRVTILIELESTGQL